MQNKRIILIVISIGLLLLVPFVAMQFTDEVKWSPFDFVAAGVLLFGAAFTYELIARKGNTLIYRIAVGVAVASGLLLVWVNLAVGIIGSENNPANLLYFGVLAVGIIGTIIAGLQPGGMSRVLFAMAAAQLLVPVIALVFWKPHVTSAEEFSDYLNGFGANTLFVFLFAGAASLFRRASSLVK